MSSGRRTRAAGLAATAGLRLEARDAIEEAAMGDYVRVAALGDVADGKSLPVTVDGVAVLVCNSRGELFAVENRCSHAEERLDCGRVRAGWVSCPVHGARFDLATGEALGPPATEPIRTFACRVVDDQIEVKVA